MTADDQRPERPTGHPDLDTLADLHAGALDEATADRVRRHVVGCRDCAAALAALDAVRDELRTLPTPPLPAAVAARLDATLADLRAGTDLRAETATRTVASSKVESPPLVDEVELARERRGRRLASALGAVAAAFVLLVAGVSVAAIVRGGGGPDGPTTDAAGAGRSAGVPGLSAQTAPDSAAERSSQLTPGTVATVARYDEASLRAALPSISEQDRVNQTGAGPGSAGALADPARRAACAGTIPNPSGALRAVQQILYQGRPAYVLVYADGDRLTGYVVTDACGTSPGLPATVLATVS